MTVVVEALDPVDEWMKRLSPGSPLPSLRQGSALIGDDRHTNPYPVSHSAWRSLCVAVDHLHCLRVLLVDAKALHTFSPFTLTRAALENAASVVWQLSPGTRNDRIVRRLRLESSNIDNSAEAQKLAGVNGKRTPAERRDDLRRLARARGIDESAAVKKIGPTAILKEAGETAFESPYADQPLRVWRSCSGVSHGDAWAMISVPAQKVVKRDGNVGFYQSSMDVAVLANAIDVTVALCETSWDLYARRGGQF